MAKKRRQPSLDLLFRALADPTRLRVLNLIAGREICVCYFVAILRLSQPKVSRHLAYLRAAGIVTARREGKWMHYRLLVPRERAAAGILRETLKHLQGREAMRRDLGRLDRACCKPQRFVHLRQAPQPAACSPGAN